MEANINNKAVLNFQEAIAYTGLSASCLYKLTSARQIPHSKPHGKLIFFNRQELEGWLLQNRITPASEIEDEARAYCRKRQ